MIINNSNLDAFYYAMRFGFQTAFSEAPTYYERLATTIPSTTRENRYPWLDMFAMPREWLGERVYHNLGSMNYTLPNKKFELSYKVKRTDLADDQYSFYVSAIAPNMGASMKRNPDLLLVDLLRNGDSSSDPKYLAFDGQPFFNGSHPVNMFDSTAGTYSNLITSSAFSSSTFTTVRTAMAKYKGSNGVPLRVSPNLLVIPRALEIAARQLLQTTTTAPTGAIGINAANVAADNIFRGMADILVIDDLNSGGTDDTTWWLFDTTKGIKPLIYQTREAPNFVALTAPNDMNVFTTDEYLYGSMSREAMGFSLPFLAAKVTA